MNRIVWDGELVSSKDLHIYDLAATQDVLTRHNGQKEITFYFAHWYNTEYLPSVLV